MAATAPPMDEEPSYPSLSEGYVPSGKNVNQKDIKSKKWWDNRKKPILKCLEISNKNVEFETKSDAGTVELVDILVNDGFFEKVTISGPQFGMTPPIEENYIHEEGASAVAYLVTHSPTLKMLSLKLQHLTFNILQPILSACIGNPNIEALDLWGSRITGEEALVIVKYLAFLPRKLKLNFGGNDIEGEERELVNEEIKKIDMLEATLF